MKINKTPRGFSLGSDLDVSIPYGQCPFSVFRIPVIHFVAILRT